jgi:hypothetical protein
MELAGKWLQEVPPKKRDYRSVPIYETEGNIRSARPSRNAPPSFFATPGSKGSGFTNIDTSRQF